MKSKLLLRIASGLMLFHLVGHLFGATTWKQTDDPVKQEVIRQMTAFKFPFMGTLRSMGNYFDGYGIITSVFLLVLVFLLWILSGWSANNVIIVRKIIVTILLALLVMGISEYIFFFPLPGSTTLLAAICTMAAWLQMRKVTA